jgi:uncharacterized protein YkwD
LILLTSLSLGSCIKVSQEPATSPAPLFVTSTLPPTKPGLSLPTDVLPTSTPDTSTTPGTPGAGTDTASASGPCKDSAVLLEDVTVPDNAPMTRGAKFTKTWRFMNSGKCKWSGYTISFVAGDRMETPNSAPIPDTEPGKTVDVSVELTAPSIDGSYTGFYELKNDKGETLSIGTEQAFWVKILIGNVAAAPAAASTVAITPINGTPVKVTGPASCNYSSSSSYLNEIANLINTARAQAGLSQLTVNPALAAAAQGHSIDMACHGLISHTGSDASTPHDRIVAAGYVPTFSAEIIYGSGYPQAAFDWWMNDQIHRDTILNANITEMGVGYAYIADTAHSYYTVDFASP